MKRQKCNSIPWSDNYNMIEVNPDDITKLMKLVFKKKIAEKFDVPASNILNIASGIPDNHLSNGQRVFYTKDNDYMLAIDALNKGNRIQIFNWDINIEKDKNNNNRFLISMPDGMPRCIANDVWRILKHEGIGMIYHV